MQISFLGTYTLALFVFIVLWLCGIVEWQIFVYAIPVSMIVLIVENALWGKRILSFLYISALVWGIIASVYVAFLSYNWWLLFLLGIPAEIIIWLCFRLKSRKRRKLFASTIRNSTVCRVPFFCVENKKRNGEFPKITV